MLGIIIGVASVIALLAYGNGVVAKALATLERNGTNLITIQGANQRTAGIATGNQSQTLTLDDATRSPTRPSARTAAPSPPRIGPAGRSPRTARTPSAPPSASGHRTRRSTPTTR